MTMPEKIMLKPWLKPCPFCGQQLQETDSGFSHGYRNDGCILDGYVLHKNACEQWNTRANLVHDDKRPYVVGNDGTIRQVPSPAVYYCENGKSLEGLEQGALAVLSNLMMKTNATSADFMIGNEKDGDFYFRCTRKPQPAVDLGMVFKSMNDILDLSSGIMPLEGENLSKAVSIDNICRKVRAHLEATGVKHE